jgi:hypothetical protein
MKPMSLIGIPLFTATLWLTLILPSSAAPLSKSQISAEAKWVLHLDLEQFGPSETCRILLKESGKGDKFKTALDHYRTLLGVDPLKALANITLYGEEVSGTRGVALIRGAIPAKALTARLSTYPEYTTRKVSGSTVHQWKDRTSSAQMNACLFSSSLTVITSDATSMDAALGILNGSRPNLGSLKNPTLTIPAPMTGAFLTAASCGYAGASPHPLKAMLLRNTTCATMQVAESQGITDATIALAAVSSDAAFQIQQILNGLIVSAAFTDESSGLAKLAELSEVKRQDCLVNLRVHCPTRDATSALAATLLQP